MDKRTPPNPPPRPPAVSDADEDRRLFERELAGVRPLPPGPQRVLRTPTAAPPPSSPLARALRPATAMLVEQQGGEVRGAAFGVSRQTLRELARGDFAPEATCDLHGLRAEPARLRLRAFIAESRARRRRAVLVICGRGVHSGPEGPVLLGVAREVLTQPPARAHVQAFVSATRAHGGEGALMVLLRR